MNSRIRFVFVNSETMSVSATEDRSSKNILVFDIADLNILLMT